MRKIIKGLAIATLSATFIGNVKAATLAIGNETVSAGSSKNVAIELRDSDINTFDKVEFQLSITGTEYAEIDSVKPSGTNFGQNAGANGETVYTFYNTGKPLEATSIGSITFKTAKDLSTNFKITPTNVKFYKGETAYQVGESGIKVIEGSIKYEKPKSTEAYLTSLKVSQGTLSPEFKLDVMEYTVQVKDTINSIRITADSSPGSTKTGTGTKTLEMGENDHEIVVTAEDGTTKNTYKIKIIRGEIAEPSAYLKKLEINNIGVELSPEFDSKNNKYTLKIGEDIEELNIKYETEDPLAEVTIEGNEKFVEGENLVKVKVLSSNKEDEQIYEITVIKEEKEETPKDEDSSDSKDDKKESKKKTWLLVIIGIVIAAVVGTVTYLLFRKKKPNDKNKGKKIREDKATVTIKTEEDETPREVEHPEDSNNLYEDDRTQKFDEEALLELKERFGGSTEEIDKTKEYTFRDLN